MVTADVLNGFDAVVVSNVPRGEYLRGPYKLTAPLVLWISQSYDQPDVQALARPSERLIWDGFAFVSAWQRDTFVEHFSVPTQKSQIMRNAIAPPFHDMPAESPWFARATPPVLVYTSTPYRGLDMLLDAFPIIRAGIPGARLRVFSSMALYRWEKDPFEHLYRRCANTEGVEYVGVVDQPRLARELRGAAALAYPTLFEETSCIAVLEAMAAGAAILTTALGALPETASGFAHMIPPQADKALHAKSFAGMAIDTLQMQQRDPEAAAARREEQIGFVRQNYDWAVRASEWAAWLATLRSPFSSSR
jgi:glycosyltransferase involved in cell wall biosynthesis